MKASLKSVRIAPKKASLVAKMIRGKSVPEAMHALEHTNKKAARLYEELLRSAMANASHNASQDPQMMVIKTVVVNKAQTYHRGVPMARGRMRPIRKFLSHIDLTLGFPEDAPVEKKSAPKKETSTSQKPKKTVKKETTTSSKGTKGKSDKETAASDSDSSNAPKDSSSSN